MPPYRGLNRAELLRGVERMLFDTRPIADKNTKMIDMFNDNYQIQQGVMTFGPGSRIPFRNPMEEQLLGLQRMHQLRKWIGASWKRYKQAPVGGRIEGSSPMAYGPVQKARIDEVGELVRELMRKSEPAIQRLENIKLKARINELLRGR